jgi:hypothetical protein
LTAPVDIANMALGQAGSQISIQSITPPLPEGSAEANTAALYYTPKIRALMRTAPWNFTRKQIRGTLLKSAWNLSTGQPSTNPPPLPFAFEYAYPPDCLDMRFIPNICYTTTSSTSSSSVPLTTGPAQTIWPPNMAEAPAPFVVGNDTDANGNMIKVIFTNQPYALLCYTAQVDDCDLWDSNFLDAAVHTLAAFFVNPLSLSAGLLKSNIEIAAQIIMNARTRDGNEGDYAQDHIPDWLQVRGTYGGAGGWGVNGWGGALWGGSWMPMAFPGGLSY